MSWISWPSSKPGVPAAEQTLHQEKHDTGVAIWRLPCSFSGSHVLGAVGIVRVHCHSPGAQSAVRGRGRGQMHFVEEDESFHPEFPGPDVAPGTTLYAYECRPEIVKLMTIQLKSITAHPITARIAVHNPLSLDFMRTWMRIA
jgi:hypothetical protein